MEKVEKDGKVAVLYSPGFGAGWSTWNSDEKKEALCMDARIVSAVLLGERELAAEIAEGLFDTGTCVLGAKKLEVIWINKGDRFEIEEYDGNESVHVLGSRMYLTA